MNIEMRLSLKRNSSTRRVICDSQTLILFFPAPAKTCTILWTQRIDCKDMFAWDWTIAVWYWNHIFDLRSYQSQMNTNNRKSTKDNLSVRSIRLFYPLSMTTLFSWFPHKPSHFYSKSIRTTDLPENQLQTLWYSNSLKFRSNWIQ